MNDVEDQQRHRDWERDAEEFVTWAVKHELIKTHMLVSHDTGYVKTFEKEVASALKKAWEQGREDERKLGEA